VVPLTLEARPAPQYKFTLGSWSAVEETSACGELANRTFTFTTADEAYPASDTVSAWDGVGSCAG